MSDARPPLRVLDELGREIDGVIVRAQPHRAPFARTVVFALLGLLTATAVAAAASFVLTGSPIPASHGADVPPEARPSPGTARLAGLAVADPGDGQPRWDLRVSRSQTGQLCTAVGQVVKGEFGLVGLDARFRRLPLLGVDACGDLARASVLIGARVFDADRPDEVRTVVNGIGGAGLRRVSVTVRDRTRELELGNGGTFMAVYRGYVEELRPRVRLQYAGGSRRSFAFGTSTVAQAPDPQGGAPWAVSAERRRGGSRAGQTCAQGQRARGREQPFTPLTPPVCGDLQRDPLFFEVAAFPRAAELTTGARQPYPWGNHAPRTLVWGAAGPSVKAIGVQHRGRSLPVALTGAGPGFIAVLPGGSAPSDVRVRVTFRSGATRTHVGGQNLRGADGRRQPSALRPPVAMATGARPTAVSYFTVIAGSTRIERRAAARDGGPPWALRVWRARARDSRVELRCVQLGRIERGVFRLPGARASGRPAPIGEPGATCAPVRDLRSSIISRDEAVVDDGSAYAPRRTATVVWGLAPAGVRDLTVSGLGARRSVPTSSRGAFLLVTSPATAQHGVVVRGRDRGGRAVSSRRRGFRPAAVVPGSERIEARAPDPDGAQPWGKLVWRLRNGDVCSAEGRIVGAGVGGVDPQRNTFHPYPTYEGGSCGPAPTRSRTEPPISLTFSSATGGQAAGSAGSRRARIQRRTLPGHTIVSGFARPDVRAITVRTPRDVRTLLPSGRTGAFLIVYDGEFFGGGAITVTAALADGTTASQRLALRP